MPVISPTFDYEKQREAVIRHEHRDHPQCDTCEILQILDIERGMHNLDILSLQAQVANLQDELDELKDIE